MNSFLLIDKPAGWTSFDCVAVTRRSVNIKRVGHTGTLDPFATGLLVVAIGKCTKMIPFLEKDRKIYRTKILFNKTTETLDTESDVVEGGEKIKVTSEALEKVLAEKFQGPIEQIPPKYSALKIDGQRAYTLARKGEDFEMKKRATEIIKTEILAVGDDWCELEIEVAAGFYVRSFARDLAEALGTTGMCGELRRIGVGGISLEDSADKILNPEDLKNPEYKIPDTAYIDPQAILNLETIEIAKDRLPDWSHGRAIKLDNDGQGEVLVTCNQKTIGLGLLGQGSLQPKVVF